jgi:hypothetical protein
MGGRECRSLICSKSKAFEPNLTMGCVCRGRGKLKSDPETDYRERVSCGCPQFLQANVGIVFLCQLVNTATSSPADDVHHYVIPQSYYPVTIDQ